MVVVNFRGHSYIVTNEQTVEAFSLAIDEVLGKDASSLVFKTAKLIYGKDYTNSLASQLGDFQYFLKKALGETTYDHIVDSAIFHMQKYSVADRSVK